MSGRNVCLEFQSKKRGVLSYRTIVHRRSPVSEPLEIAPAMGSPLMTVEGQRSRKKDYSTDDARWNAVASRDQRYFGLAGELKKSRLARIPESQYRSPDIDRAETEREPRPGGPAAE
jgi:hypothetical protein